MLQEPLGFCTMLGSGTLSDVSQRGGSCKDPRLGLVLEVEQVSLVAWGTSGLLLCVSLGCGIGRSSAGFSLLPPPP